jgi:hypothetical protein
VQEVRVVEDTWAAMNMTPPPFLVTAAASIDSDSRGDGDYVSDCSDLLKYIVSMPEQSHHRAMCVCSTCLLRRATALAIAAVEKQLVNPSTPHTLSPPFASSVYLQSHECVLAEEWTAAEVSSLLDSVETSGDVSAVRRSLKNVPLLRFGYPHVYNVEEYEQERGGKEGEVSCISCSYDNYLTAYFERKVMLGRLDLSIDGSTGQVVAVGPEEKRESERDGDGQRSVQSIVRMMHRVGDSACPKEVLLAVFEYAERLRTAGGRALRGLSPQVVLDDLRDWLAAGRAIMSKNSDGSS